MRKTAYQMRELAACALHGKVPSQELLAQVDPEKLYIMCQFHCLTAMVAVALRSAGIRSTQWEEEHVKAVRKSILLAAERRKLCEFLEQNGIWYLPLKGIVLESMSLKSACARWRTTTFSTTKPHGTRCERF